VLTEVSENSGRKPKFVVKPSRTNRQATVVGAFELAGPDQILSRLIRMQAMAGHSWLAVGTMLDPLFQESMWQNSEGLNDWPMAAVVTNRKLRWNTGWLLYWGMFSLEAVVVFSVRATLRDCPRLGCDRLKMLKVGI